jgi:hypothetical protein
MAKKIENFEDFIAWQKAGKLNILPRNNSAN